MDGWLDMSKGLDIWFTCSGRKLRSRRWTWYGRVCKSLQAMYIPSLQTGGVMAIDRKHFVDSWDKLSKALYLYLIDPHSSVNHIRQALELILNHEGVIKRVKRKSPKKGYHILALDHRITHHWKNPNVNHAEALKIIGNEGSHSSGSVTTDDVFDALDILEHVLEDLYSRRAVTVQRLSKAILKRNNTRSSKKTR